MTPEEYWGEYYEFSGKVSDRCRHLALAGLAVIWIFRIGDTAQAAVPKALILPAILFVVALALDLLQFVWAAVCWRIVARRREVEKQAGKADRDHSPRLVWPMELFWSLKIAGVLIGQVLLIAYLWRTLT